ncbi:T9SS type A sorting domain-containing protein [bacterium]|nr:T9SS type A sorting domain-containing protein [bacterium]
MHRKLLILFALVAACSWAAPRNSFLTDSVVDRSAFRHAVRYPSNLDEDSLHQFDVTKLAATLAFDIDNSELWGDVTIKLRADEIPLNRLDFRFSSALTIDSIWSDITQVDRFEVEGDDSLQIYLVTPLAVGDSTEIRMVYHGQPEIIDAWGGIFMHPRSGWRPPIVYSMGDGLDLEPPPANHTWIPSYADPTDKLLWETWITADDSLTALSNGVLVESEPHDTTITWHYRMDQPVSTYLLFVSVSIYEIMVQRESDPYIANFVYPSRVNQAPEHFLNVPAVLDGFVELFGDYPFDAFGFNMCRNGDMEHATSVSHFDSYVVQNHTYDGLLFHELSHMWWGDWVTLGEWKDMWLNEGFASYCEALGMEIIGGRDEYLDYMLHDLMPAARGAANFTVYDPDDYWSSVVYEKGGCVLHMLRWVMGDSSFFQSLREYGAEHAYGNAVTADFQAKCEEHYGESLQWFFDQWVYSGTGYPRFEVENTWEGDIWGHRLRQTQTIGTYFRMPVEIEGTDWGGETRIDTVWIHDMDFQDIDFEDAAYWFGVDTIIFDPNNWLLKTVSYSYIINAEDEDKAIPTEFAFSNIYPNPFNQSTTIEFDIPVQSEATLIVHNIQGQEVFRKLLGSLSPGTHHYHWDGREYSSGIYLYSLKTNNHISTKKAVLLK